MVKRLNIDEIVIVTPKTTCPACNKELERTTHSSGTRQEPCEGDISVCIGCGNLMEFNADLTLRNTTMETLGVDAPTRTQIECMISIIKSKRHCVN